MSEEPDTAALNFTNQKSLEVWLETRSQEDCVTIAARAALRSVPMLSAAMTATIDDPGAAIILPVFRAISASSSSRWGIDEELAGAASAAFSAAAYAASAAFSAADSAASAAFSAAASAAFSADSAAFSAASAARSAAWEILSSDVTILATEGRSALLARPLWPGDMPDGIAEDWQTLKSALLARQDKNVGEDWAVWTDWYENQRRGGPFDPTLERAIALISADIWEQGPKVANAEIRRLVNEHKPPAPPPQESAPITAEVSDGKIIRRDPASPDHKDDMARLHTLLFSEAVWLDENLSSQHGQLCALLNHIRSALGASFAETDELMLGFYSNPIAARAKTADEELMPDPASRLQGFAANLSLFVLRLDEWRKHIAEASQSPVTVEEAKAGEEAAKGLITALRDWKDLFDETLAEAADDLYLGLADSLSYGPETPYGFYRSLMNVVVITAQAALDVIPTGFIDEETDELKKTLRKNARKFIYEQAGTLLRITGAVAIWKPLEAVILHLRNLLS